MGVLTARLDAMQQRIAQLEKTITSKLTEQALTKVYSAALKV